MDQQPMTNGAPSSSAPPVRRKKPAGADALFKPTNNQKKRYPLGGPPSSTARPPPPRPTTYQPNLLKSVATYTGAQAQSDVQSPHVPTKDYKIVVSKRELVDGTRYHLMQLDDKLDIDIRNDTHWTRPARLVRRNPDWKPSARNGVGDETKEGDAEAEAINKRKEARQKEREANLAQIAPSANSNRRKLFNKKTAQVYHNDYTEEEKRRIQMNYEEKLPWILEDFDGKQTLVGKHKQASMGVYAGFAQETGPDGNIRFRMVPIEKAYRFEKPQTLQEGVDWEQIEKDWKSKRTLKVEPETLKRAREQRQAEREREHDTAKARRLFVADAGLLNTRTGEDADLDFEDDFADDEEGDIFGDKDDDEKAAEKKVKEDHLRANIGWQEKDEREIEEADKREEANEALKKVLNREMRKALEKRERNFNLGSSSDDDFSVSLIVPPFVTC
jgi:transcription initiation factor TFIIF subunit alpha